MPRMPPARESNTLSVSNWRTMRARPAPSAERIANSRLRTVARTSSRLATLAQEISSTSPTAPSIISSELRASPMMLSRNGPTVKCGRGSVFGNSRWYSGPTASNWALACATVTPGWSSPVT